MESGIHLNQHDDDISSVTCGVEERSNVSGEDHDKDTPEEEEKTVQMVKKNVSALRLPNINSMGGIGISLNVSQKMPGSNLATDNWKIYRGPIHTLENASYSNLV